MPVERKEDGSISIKTKKSATVISKIISTQVCINEEKYQQWVEDCAKSVTASAHT